MLYHKSYGAGKPLYLLHGWALNSRVWDHVVNNLKEHWLVTTVDLPGHGKSKPPESGDYNIDVLTHEVSQLINEASVIVGWSLGGMVALNLACRYPDLVDKLVLVASTPQFINSNDWRCAIDKAILDGFAADLVKDYRATVMRFLAIQTLGSEQSKQAVREMREKVFINGEPHLDSLTKGLTILRESNLRNEARQIRCPTLIMLGEKDTLIPVCSAELTRQLIPDCKISIVAGAGHAPFISHPGQFMQSLTEFLN